MSRPDRPASSHTSRAPRPPREAPEPRQRHRRSQEERRAQTRLALLDATVECLIERGYPRTTTSSIARRAGVSVGALQHHFDSKTDLLAGAIEHVLERRLDEFAKAMANRHTDVDDFDAAIDILWEQLSGSTFLAWLELTLAGRTDHDLGPAMAATDARFTAAAAEQFATWFGHVPGLQEPGARARILEFAFAILKGLAVERINQTDDTPARDETAVVQSLKDVSRLAFPRDADIATDPRTTV